MRRSTIWSCALLGVIFTTAGARGDAIVGAAVTVPENFSIASIEFLGSEAGYTGELYFLGWGSSDDVINFAADTGQPGFGQRLHNNHNAQVGDMLTLDGSFMAGDVLHFAYMVLQPEIGIDLFRTDLAADRNQFMWNGATNELLIEDLRLPESDADYNDACFLIQFNPASIPAPGAWALLIAAGCCNIGSRRRTV